MSIALPPSGRYRVQPEYGRVLVTVLRVRCCPMVCMAKPRPKYGQSPSRVSTGVVGRPGFTRTGLVVAGSPMDGPIPESCELPPEPPEPPHPASSAAVATATSAIRCRLLPRPTSSRRQQIILRDQPPDRRAQPGTGGSRGSSPAADTAATAKLVARPTSSRGHLGGSRGSSPAADTAATAKLVARPTSSRGQLVETRGIEPLTP